MAPKMTERVAEKAAVADSAPVKKPPWYKRRGLRRGIGIALGGVGAVIVLAPGAPVVATVAGIGITTTMIGVGVTWIATNVFSYGAGAATERDKKPVE